MFIENLADNANLFFLILVRVFAMLAVAPLFSSDSIPDVVRAGLAFFTAIVVFPWIQAAGYPIPADGLMYLGLLVGEALLGILMGFFLVLVFSVFQMIGDFFSLQMGFSASEVYDPLAMIEIPIVGQFLNLIAMFVFLSIQGFQQIFMVNVFQSFRGLRAVDFLIHPNFISDKLIVALGQMFQHAFLIALPVFGTLLIVSLVLGLLGKAAPQMNLMMMGFPISISVGFIMIVVSMPFLVQAFAGVVNHAFRDLGGLIDALAPPGRFK